MPRGSTLEIPTKEGISLGESDFPLQCPQKDLSRLDFSLSLSFVVRPPDQPTPPPVCSQQAGLQCPATPWSGVTECETFETSASKKGTKREPNFVTKKKKRSSPSDAPNSCLSKVSR